MNSSLAVDLFQLAKTVSFVSIVKYNRGDSLLGKITVRFS